MPIRMEKDSPNQGSNNNQNQQRSGGKINPLLILGAIFIIFKKPQWLIPILIAGAVWYFFLGGNEMFSPNGGASAPGELENSAFSLGATLSQEQFDKAKVFEPLATSYGNSALPAKVSLEQYAPTPKHQGRQGSCVGWASAYAARTILESRATGQNPDQLAFSPSYLYNQIHLTNCQGAYMLDAMKTMQQNGGVPFDQFGYDERSCSNKPGGSLVQIGRQYQINGYNRLTKGAGNYALDMEGIKQNLAQGAPVVIGTMVGGSFMTNMNGQKLWQPTQRDYSQSGFGGHAMCIIGYDDELAGGAFRVQNSWGTRWGDNGRFWITYKDFQHFTKEAYGLHPMGSADNQEKFDDKKFAAEFGLLDVNREATIPVQRAGDIVFRTRSPLTSADKFKVLFANTIACYVYIFGEETDGSSYVLFPYTEKHDPYCGITGTRLFPRDYSMSPDEVGNRDRIAIIITKQELDFQGFNQAITAAAGNSFVDKVKNALGQARVRTAQFQAGNTIAVQGEADKDSALAMIIEVDK